MENTQNKLPINSYSLCEQKYDAHRKKQHIPLFFIGNGNLGLPSYFNEDENSVLYINGFYENAPYIYGEKAYGYPENKQTMLPLASPMGFKLQIDGEILNLDHIQFSDYQRCLNFKDGLLKRSFIWHLKNDKKVKVIFSHMLSMVYLNSGFITLNVTPLDDRQIDIKITSSLAVSQTQKSDNDDPRKAEGFKHNVWQTKKSTTHQTSGEFSQKTALSNMHFMAMVAHQSNMNCFDSSEATDDGLYFNFSAQTNQTIQIQKFFSYITNIECTHDEIESNAQTAIQTITDLGIEKLIHLQKEYLADFWSHADIQIEGDKALQQGIRYNIFGLIQSAGHDGKRSIAAKGLSSDGYEGHYFWDAESYIIPHFIYTAPHIAKAMLTYRYHTLDAAIKRAGELSHKGALYPWRTINGSECSAFFPAGTAQYHINADIALAIKQYVQVTEDTAFLEQKGQKILFEIARFFMSFGHYLDHKGFVLNTVTGPDEYTAIVDNNMYTNIMVKDALSYAASLKQDDESQSWQKAADHMYIPYSADLAIHMQDDRFLNKKKWDFENTPKEKYPLLLHYHPLNIYRHQVLKQPDVVLANLFQSQYFCYADKRRNFDYYNPLCTGDSSLAPSVQSIMASELNQPQLAMQYFNQTARMDLDDLHDNVSNGIHTACMAGTWLTTIQGFGGFRHINGSFYFTPSLPNEWKSLCFKLTLKGCLLEIHLEKHQTTYTLIKGNSLTFHHYGEPITLNQNQHFTASTAFALKAVIFDLDGVVTDTAELHFKAWRKMADKIQLTFDRDTNEKLRGVTRRRSLEIILEHNNVHFAEEKIHQLMEEKNNIYQDLLNDISPKDILPGINDFLDELKKNNIKTALASASRNAPRILKQLGLNDYFDLIVDVLSLKRNKPDPEIFLSACEQLGIHYKNAAGIEDAAAGIEAISLAGGMMPVGIGSAASEGFWCLENTHQLNLKALQQQFKQFHQKPQ